MSEITKPIVLDETAQKMAEALMGIERALYRKSYTLYTIHISGSEGDCASKITYMDDAVGMTPAKMDFDNGTFNYGSWKNAFFMPKPCMVRQSGGVDYYLDQENYDLKEDGTASDVGNTAYPGNAMMEWGQNGKKIWYKIIPDKNDESSATIHISDMQLDSDYVTYSFVNNQGHTVEQFYTPIYNGSNVDSVLRSLSGQKVSGSRSGTDEISMAKANNKDGNVCWYTEVFADRILINMLLLLMFKTTDIPSALGRGIDSGSEAAFNSYTTGALNEKGMFFGYNDGTHAVKVFGMENWWGLQWRRTAGYVNDKGAQKVKMTYGMQDGSTAEGYNTDGTGYISAGSCPALSGSYISKMRYVKNCFVVSEGSGSSSTHYPDGSWSNNGQNNYALFGAGAADGLLDGPFAVALATRVSRAGWNLGAAISYKPLG